MDSDIVLNSVALILSVIAVAISSVIAIRQSRIMQQSNLVPVITDVMKEYLAPEFKQQLAYVINDLPNECPRSMRFDELPEIPRRHAVSVADYFYTVGILVVAGVISDVVVSGYMGRSVLRAWRSLEPYIRNERDWRKDDHFHMVFENLAVLMNKNPPDQINKRLRLRTMPVQLVPAEQVKLDPSSAESNAEKH
jgi:hypothetical protein